MTDEALVNAFCQGETSRFGELYTKYYRFAVGIARCQLSDIHLAEDAAQESFAEAYRSLDSLKEPTRFAAWLGTICRRTASRMAAVRRTNLLNQQTVADLTDTKAITHLRTEVQEALDQLDDVSRELVMLHYFSGLSYEELSRVCELSEPSIHGRLQRARQKLAHLLKPENQVGAKS